jgi:hypothetical protein
MALAGQQSHLSHSGTALPGRLSTLQGFVKHIEQHQSPFLIYTSEVERANADGSMPGRRTVEHGDEHLADRPVAAWS